MVLLELLKTARAIDPVADSESDAEKPEKIPDVSPGFRVTESTVEYWLEPKEGDGKWTFVCSRFDVVAVIRNSNGEHWGRLLALRDRDGTPHEWAMPMEMLAGSGEEYRRRLLSMGIEIAPGRSARDRLHQFISMCRPAERVRCVSRIGWHEESFVLIETIFADGGYQGPRMAATVATTGCWKLEIVKPTDAHRFVALPKRWIVERTFAWISRNRRLARDFERYARTVVAFVRLAMIRIMLRRLTPPTPC